MSALLNFVAGATKGMHHTRGAARRGGIPFVAPATKFREGRRFGMSGGEINLPAAAGGQAARRGVAAGGGARGWRKCVFTSLTLLSKRLLSSGNKDAHLYKECMVRKPGETVGIRRNLEQIWRKPRDSRPGNRKTPWENDILHPPFPNGSYPSFFCLTATPRSPVIFWACSLVTWSPSPPEFTPSSPGSIHRHLGQTDCAWVACRSPARSFTRLLIRTHSLTDSLICLACVVACHNGTGALDYNSIG
eukprot:gene6989-biopygen2982